MSADPFRMTRTRRLQKLAQERREEHIKNMLRKELNALVESWKARALKAEHRVTQLETKVAGLEAETRRWSEAHRVQTIDHLNECKRIREEHRSKLF